MIAAATAASQPDTTSTDAVVARAAAATGATPPPAAAGKPAGVPPEERWPSILDNARTKAAEEALRPFAWAKGMDANEAKQGIQILQALKKDAGAFWRELGTRIGAAETPPASAGEKFPDPDLQSSDGAKAYSAERLTQILDIFERRLMTKFQGELRPLMEFQETELGTREYQQTVGKARNLAGQTLTHARTLPHFKEHEAEIVAELQAMDPATKNAVGPIAAMYMAFEKVKQEKVYPTISSQAEERVRAENAKKAAAGGIHPAGGDGKPAEKPVLRGPNDLAAHLARLEQSNDPRFASA